MAIANYAASQQASVSHHPREGVHHNQARKFSRTETIDGFIHHPADFPIAFKRPGPLKKQGYRHTERGTLGLTFRSEKYIKPGSLLEVTITLRGEEQKFTGRIVLVRNQGDHFEIGLWLTSHEDASRLRIVEQICHIESYLREKRHREGPFISREKVAQEWVHKFAATFPTL